VQCSKNGASPGWATGIPATGYRRSDMVRSNSRDISGINAVSCAARDGRPPKI
jgi:hypothetical protein